MKFLIKVNQGSHILLSSLQKKFLRKTYISYTTCGKYQYILVISGEGLGVGFSMGVGYPTPFALLRSRKHMKMYKSRTFQVLTSQCLGKELARGNAHLLQPFVDIFPIDIGIGKRKVLCGYQTVRKAERFKRF